MQQRKNHSKPEIELAVIIITENNLFYQRIYSVLNDICPNKIKITNSNSSFYQDWTSTNNHSIYSAAKEKVCTFIGKKELSFNLHLFQADNLENAVNMLKDLNKNQKEQLKIGPVFIDSAKNYQDEIRLDADLDTFFHKIEELSIHSIRTPYSTINYCPDLDFSLKFKHNHRFISRVISEELWIFETDILCFFVDFIEKSFTSIWSHRLCSLKNTKNTLGNEIYNFLSNRADKNWIFLSYTGSLVSSMINYLEEKCTKKKIKVLRGPSEHSLACMAMANWQLYKEPFLIVITSGMMDEFKGTLANLKETKAKGIIVCAEGRESLWFPFQGTINPDEDIRDVLSAKRISYVYLQELDKIPEKLSKAFELYESDNGPVVILASQKVLESSSALDAKISYPQIITKPKPSLSQDFQHNFSKILEMINNGPINILWQCGKLSEEEREKIYLISKKTGIALADSLAHPGTLTKYTQGKINKNYIGTLGLYGFSSRVYHFLHTNNKLNSASTQAIFFLKSKIAQIASPFSASALDKKLNICQVTNNPNHMASYANYPLLVNLNDFLDQIIENLKVNPLIKEKRENFIKSIPESASDVISDLPSLPMSPNYFFKQLNSVIEELIKKHNYQYTGIYDVGRCGISAVRNLVKTGPGFSGWYGRALIGDALLAVPTIALNSGNNILAFIGDGAKSLVPDTIPFLVQNLLNNKENLNKNISIFFFYNHSLSLINTYQETLKLNPGGNQMIIHNFNEDEFIKSFGKVNLSLKNIKAFDKNDMSKSLVKPATINIFNVFVGKNNEGDGLGLINAKGWQSDKFEPTKVKTEKVFNNKR